MKMIRDRFLARQTLLIESYRESHTTKSCISKILNLKQNVDCRTCVETI